MLVHALLAQNVPFTMDHPIYHFLDRQEALGNINSEYWSTRPYNYVQINKMLDEIDSKRSTLSQSDVSILNRFQHEFNREFEEGIVFPWNKTNYKRLIHPDRTETKPFFISYRQSGTRAWINWSETFRIQNNGKSSRGYYTDHLGIFGEMGQISFTSQLTYHRVTKNDDFQKLPESFKEGYILDEDYIDWITWDYPLSSLVYTHPNFSLGIHRQPVYWGYSSMNSPILSDNVNPLPHIEWSTRTTHLRYKFLHARLSPNDIPKADTLNDRRNISAHRVEFDVSPNFEFAFTELVVYANRDYELAYLNPVNFLYSEEHVQGDLDNLLMALDFKWRLHPGFSAYGTWFFDELNWYKLFSGWWGNKFVFQLGVNYYPHKNLPSVNIEYTAARPWTYAHKYPINSFTSAGRILGLKQGPNTEILHFGTNWQLSSKFNLAGEVDFLARGDDLGSDPLISYLERGDFAEADQDFIVGKLIKQTNWLVSADYYYNRTVLINLRISNGEEVELGVKLDW